ncbi:MAG: hypothetical protein M3T55_14500, partial [Pseudomonadota bacterium]|nr:hypothetical protein [Pseudomonadota bacterium]
MFLVDGGFVANGGGQHAVTTSLIQGQNVGVAAGGALKLYNGGTIYGVNGQGVYLQTGGSIVSDGRIESKDAQAIYAKTGAATIRNLGEMVAKANTAVLLAAGGSIYNYGGIISQAGVAVSLGAAGTITNGAASGGGLEGSIEGVSAGVSAVAVATVVNADGSIYGQVGVDLAAGGLIDNGALGAIGGRTGVGGGG